MVVVLILLGTGVCAAAVEDFSGELPGASGSDGTVAVNVRTVPDGATVTIDGQVQGAKTPAYFYVSPGVHRVKVTLAGYQTYKDEFRFPDEELPIIHLEKAVEGTLHIDTTPQDASVYLDGEYKGQTPVDIQTSVGTHELMIKDQMYQTIEKTVELPGERLGIHYNLKPGSGSVYIWSIPEATILINGEKQDLEFNPGLVELDPGTYTITARKEGYTTEKKEITVKGADTQDVYFVLSGPGGQYTRVNDDIMNIGITSVPEGATVSINGEERQEKTPGVYRVHPGKNQVRLQLPTYQIYDEEIAFPEESPLVVPLVRSPTDHPDPQGPSPQGSGKLNVEVTPADATISIDGSNVDSSRPLELDVGEYLVKASRDGYVSQQNTIRIKKDQTTSISIHLVPEDEQSDDLGPIIYQPGPDTVHITINSIPLGAEVIYRGKTLGTTPFSRDVRPRVYMVELRLEGYEPTFSQMDTRNYTGVYVVVDMETGIWDWQDEESEEYDQ